MALWSKVGMLFIAVVVLLIAAGAVFYFEFFDELVHN
jgi:hypothetical protein